METIYLDHAATTPIDPEVLLAMQPFLTDGYANPSSVYSAARVTRQAVEAARSDIADVIGAKTTEIIFTSGGTEGDNLAVQGVLRRAGISSHWVTTAIEHDAVLSQTEPLRAQGFNATIVAVDSSGVVKASEIVAAITDQTVLVSVMLANNEIGTIQPIAEIARLIEVARIDRMERGINCPLYLHTDACQAGAFLSLQVTRLGVDLMTINGSKLYGPKGVGALYVRHGIELEPLFYGGGQERGRRSGTENVAGVVGLAAALRLAWKHREADSRQISALRDSLLISLTEAIPNLIINGSMRHRLPGNLNLTLLGAEGEALVLYLDNVGIMASTGSACSTGNLDPSHVLLAIGRSRNEAQQSLRLSLGRSTSKTAVLRVAKELPSIVARLRQLG